MGWKKAAYLSAVISGVCLSPSSASELHGIWRLISFQNVVEGEPPQNMLGDNPKGHLIMAPEGRMIALLTASERKAE